MKKLFLLSFAIVLMGAGCLGSDSANSSADGGVFKTVTAGEEWGQVVIVPTAAGIGTLATTNIVAMEMDPQDNNFLYIGTRTNGMLYSEDAGASWRQPTYSAMQSGEIYDIEVDASDVCTVYVAKSSRLLMTNDCMRSFDSEVYVENRSGVEVTQIAIDWYDGGNIWVGLSNGDVLMSDDGGGTWKTSLQTGGEITEMIVSNADSRQLLVSTLKDSIYKTTDRGESWEQIEGQLEELKKADNVYAMVQSDGGSTVIASTTYSLMRSTDFGSTWEALKLVSSPGQVTIRAVGIDGANPSTIYYAAGETFYRSLDSGSTWNTERFPSSRVPEILLVDPDDSSVLYVGVASSTE
jgi:photosystem II stability/assembly factor-like uncharacterized protein